MYLFCANHKELNNVCLRVGSFFFSFPEMCGPLQRRRTLQGSKGRDEEAAQADIMTYMLRTVNREQRQTGKMVVVVVAGS